MAPRSPSFVHLHIHSEYSLLDGTCRLRDLANRTAELGQPAVALTDHGVLYGLIPFQQACQDAHVKPIFGCEVYLGSGSRLERSGKLNNELRHLLLLAQNQEGYRNLLRIVSAAHLEGFYYKPRIDRELLAQHHEGLIAVSACLQGEIPLLLRQEQKEAACKLAGEYRDIMGAENFFIELMDHGIPAQKEVNPRLVELAREMDIPLIASNDVHYLRQSDAEAHDVLLCIQTNSVRDDPKRLRFHGDQFYYKTPEEMAALFPETPEALSNTLRIAERCNVTIPVGGMILPEYPIPEGHTMDSYLRHLCLERLPQRFSNPKPELKRRLEKELAIISKRGLAAFLLIAWDLMEFARRKDILVGPGRGSAPGALVLYVLGVTEVNPIRFGLPFERWTNLERISMPDIDCDFEPSRREEVIEYAVSRYGAERVAQIITFGTIGARQALRDAGRVLRVPIPEVDRICKRVGPMQSLSEFLGEDAEMREEVESNASLHKLMDTARTIEGLARHASTHAGGVVISREPLTEIAPLQRIIGGNGSKDSRKEAKDENAPLRVMTQFDMDSISAVGLPKMDVLGLRTLGVLRETLRLVEKSRDKKLDLGTLPLDDRATFALLGRGETNGLFQLESAGMKQVLCDLRPDRFDDIVAVVALYRPGPMAQIPNYIAGKHGKRKVTYLHPVLEPILAETYGIIIYQEQVMEIARHLGGFSMGKADALLNAMRKKKRELMASLEEEFMRGAKGKEVPEKVARQVFKQMSDFAGYGFNKAHSACYALSAYQTAYLKANFPAEYMAAQLSSVMDNKDKSTALIQECRRMGIEVLPPDINESEEGFAIDKGRIRFGLAAIKHLGVNAIRTILSVRKAGGLFQAFDDFCRRLPAGSINRTGMEVLAKTGALCSLGMTRAGVLEALAAGLAPGKASLVPEGQESLFGDEAEAQASGIMGSLPGTDVPEFPRLELLTMEKELLGLYLSDHPLNSVKDALEQFTTAKVEELAESNAGEVTLGGIITALRRHTDRSGRAMAFATLEDFTGAVEMTIFADAFERCRQALEAEAIVLVRGRVESGARNAEASGDAPPRLLANDIVLISDVKGRERMKRRNNKKSAGNRTRKRNNGNRREPMAAAAPDASSRKAGSVHIRLSAPAENNPSESLRASLDQIKRVIGEFHGSAPVLLHLDSGTGQQILKLGPSFNVQPDDVLLRRLESLLGKEKVWLEGN